MWRADSFEKTLLLGNIEGGKRRGRQRMRWLDDITDTMDMGVGRLWEVVMDREAWHAAIHRVAKSRTQLSDWTELNWICVAMGKSQVTSFSSSGFLFFYFFLFKESDYNNVPITKQLQRSKEMINAASPVPGTQKLFHQLLTLSYFWPSLSFHLLKEASWSMDV